MNNTRRQIFLAIRNNDVALVENLLKSGVDVNTRMYGRAGASLLMFAAVFGNLRMIKLLLKYKPNLKFVHTEPGHCHRPTMRITALNCAKHHGHVEAARLIEKYAAS